MTELKVGLVLSGGGAKGAYQVGVVKALVEMGAQVDAIAGASIGALNGALLASADSLAEGAKHMEELWLTLADSPPLQGNIPAYIQLLLVSGLHFNGTAHIARILHIANTVLEKSPLASRTIGKALRSPLLAALDSGIMSDAPIKKILDKYLDIEKLARGLPLYISVFRSQGSVEDIIRCMVAEVGVLDTPPSEFLHVQSLPPVEQKEALLASAAIPLLFSPRQVNDTIYTDGGQGGWQKMQGNTPVTPLIEHGYKQIIVTHLGDGSLWSRHSFPEATILEIRPKTPIGRDGLVPDILAFNLANIESWIEQGYADTMHCLDRVMRPVKSRYELQSSQSELEHSADSLINSELAMQDAMRKLL
ncbi:MAG: patatin-like phospholipase family protein [Moraxellaceae bacterium]|nr:patatin-like phospholipase family protein [Moraxellaceae bacterium]